MKTFSRSLIFATFITCPFFVLAADDVVDSDQVETGGIEALKKALAIKLPGAPITQVKETPIKGIFEVIIGAQVVYTTEDVRYVIDGDLIELATKKNFTEESRAVIRLTKIEELGEENMIVYTPETVNYTITVVTDINCPYCRRLHDEMDEYMENGIKVRYIFMPLKGKDDFDTTVSVWCADDRNLALDKAKSGRSVKKASCDNPIETHLNLAKHIGVRGTPAIILENGDLLPGYVPVKNMVQQLGIVRSAAK